MGADTNATLDHDPAATAVMPDVQRNIPALAAPDVATASNEPAPIVEPAAAAPEAKVEIPRQRQEEEVRLVAQNSLMRATQESYGRAKKLQEDPDDQSQKPLTEAEKRFAD